MTPAYTCVQLLFKNLKLVDINPNLYLVLGMSCQPQPQPESNPDTNLHLGSTQGSEE